MKEEIVACPDCGKKCIKKTFKYGWKDAYTQTQIDCKGCKVLFLTDNWRESKQQPSPKGKGE
jgi:hypothetical protein